jgi:hypothetical protein
MAPRCCPAALVRLRAEFPATAAAVSGPSGGVSHKKLRDVLAELDLQGEVLKGLKPLDVLLAACRQMGDIYAERVKA